MVRIYRSVVLAELPGVVRISRRVVLAEQSVLRYNWWWALLDRGASATGKQRLVVFILFWPWARMELGTAAFAAT